MAPYLKPDDFKHICRPVDWFGLNHYSPHYVVASDNNPLGLWFGSAPAGCAAHHHGLAGRAGRVPRNSHRHA